MRVIWMSMIMMAAGAAEASPLGPVWTQAMKCPGETDGPILATKDEVMWVDGTKLIRRARATGAELPAIKVDAKSAPMIARDGLAVVRTPKQVAVVDLATGKQLWKKKLATSYTQLAGGRLGYLAGSAKTASIEIVDAKTGTKQWSFPITGAKNRITSWGLGDTLAFVAEQRQDLAELQVVTAYKLADGKPAWTYKRAAKGLGGGVAAVGDDALIEDGGLVWLDAKATSLATLPVNAWYLADGAVTADRIYLLANAGSNLVGLDRKSHKMLWTVPTGHTNYDSLVATGGTIYTRTDDELIERDPKTGAPVARLGVSGVRTVGAADGSPSVIACDRKQLVGYGAGAPDIALEDATVSGTVVCPSCEADKALVVTIAGVQAKVDAKGAFSMKLKARGRYMPDVSYAESEEMGGIYSIESDKVKPIAFTGARTYKLTLAVEGHMQDGE